MPVNTCGMLQLRSGSITVVAADCMQRAQFVCHKKGMFSTLVMVVCLQREHTCVGGGGGGRGAHNNAVPRQHPPGAHMGLAWAGLG